MALIGKIRENSWILIALMVLALGGFIIMDIVSNAQNYSSNDMNTVGKVGGVELVRIPDPKLFQRKEQEEEREEQRRDRHHEGPAIGRAPLRPLFGRAHVSHRDRGITAKRPPRLALVAGDT